MVEDEWEREDERVDGRCVGVGFFSETHLGLGGGGLQGRRKGEFWC